MKITVINEAAASTSVWSGGTSRQYYIFPPSASYGERNFAFRMSLATSSSEAEAPYSNLENITRHLVMLDGAAHVVHKGHYELDMHPYAEIDVFDGGWESSGTGKVTDFNLMVAKGVHGRMSVIAEDKTVDLGGGCEQCSKRYNRTAFFCGSGSASLVFSTGETFRLDKGALLLVEEMPDASRVAVGLSEAKLVRMDVCCH